MKLRDFVAEVESGKLFRIKFETNQCWLNGKEVTSFEPDGLPCNLFNVVELMYADYKNSMPTKNDRGRYFKAKTADEMTIGEMARGADREVAKATLEGAVLWCKVNDLVPPINGWFWQSKVDPDLVILKSWVE